MPRSEGVESVHAKGGMGLRNNTTVTGGKARRAGAIGSVRGENWTLLIPQLDMCVSKMLGGLTSRFPGMALDTIGQFGSEQRARFGKKIGDDATVAVFMHREKCHNSANRTTKLQLRLAKADYVIGL